jgi:O-antigen/teichoic acid export membrane protein
MLDYFAKIGVGLLITPILVSALGRSLYGLWEILGRLVGYMSATDGRPTEALRLIIANEQAIDDPASKQRLIGGALGVWILFLPILMTVGGIIVWITPTIAKVSPELSASVRLTAALLVINFLLVNLAALPESVLRGMNLGYKRMGLQAGLTIVGGCLTAGAIYLGAGLVGVAGAQVALTALTGLLFWYVVKKYIPWFGLVKPTRTDLRRLLQLSVWNTAGTVIAKIQLTSDVLILGIIASASMVSTYVLTGYAAQAVTGILTLAVSAVTPGLAGLIGGNQFEKTAALRNEILEINWLLVTAVGSTILLWNRSFLHLWVGDQYYAGVWANLLIILLMVQTSFIRTDAYLIDANLKLRDRVIVNSVAAVMSVGGGIVLTPRLGIVGLCLGMLGGRMVQTVLFPLMVSSYLSRSRSFSLKTLTRPALVMALLFLTASYMGQRILADSWIEWSAVVIASIVITTLVAMITGLSFESRRRINKRMRLILKSSFT